LHLTFDWEEPYRQQRIESLIDGSDEPHTPAASRRMQADIFSAAFARLKPRMLALLDQVRPER
jgi:penicillin amidase